MGDDLAEWNFWPQLINYCGYTDSTGNEESFWQMTNLVQSWPSVDKRSLLHKERTEHQDTEVTLPIIEIQIQLSVADISYEDSNLL